MSSDADAPVPGAGLGDSAELDSAGATRRLRNGLISLALLVVLVVGLLLAIPGLHGVAHEVTHMSAAWLVVAVVLEILSCAAYVVAFLQVFDRAPIRFGARVALTELAFGVTVSLGGAGSAAIGSWLLVQRGGRPTRVAERSLVLFLLTSAINAITLVVAGIALFTGLLPGPSNPLLSIVPAAAGALALAAVMALPRLIGVIVAHTKAGHLQTVLVETARGIRDTERLLLSRDWRIIGAIGYLWSDIGVLIACFAAAGNVPDLAAIVLAYQIGYLSNLIPIPGNVGVLDGSLVGMFVLYGVSATTATAATLVYHAIALWIPAMWGTAAFLVLQRSRGTPLTLRPSREERRRLRSAE